MEIRKLSHWLLWL